MSPTYRGLTAEERTKRKRVLSFRLILMRQFPAEGLHAGAEPGSGRRGLAIEQRRLDHLIVIAQRGKGRERERRLYVLPLQPGDRRVTVEDGPEPGTIAGRRIQIAERAARRLQRRQLI